MKHLLRTARVDLLACLVLLLAQVLRLTRRRRSRKVQPSSNILLIGAYGNGNFGDDIIGEAIVDALHRRGHAVHIAARLPDIDRLKRDVAPVTVVGGGIRSLLRTWQLSHGYDLAILGGGGLLEGRPGDVNVHRLILEYLGKLAVCGLRGQRLVIHGIGVSPVLYSNPLVNRAASAMLRVVDAIGVRDPASHAKVTEVGGSSVLMRDPAVALFSTWRGTVQREPGQLGVVLLDHHRWPTFTPGSPSSESVRREELTKLAQELVERTREGSSVRLFSFHWSDVPIARDVEKLFRELGGAATSIVVAPYEQNHSRDPFLSLMRCDEVLTMRFHPALAALTGGSRVTIVGRLQKLEELQRSTPVDSSDWSYPAEYADPIKQLDHALGS